MFAENNKISDRQMFRLFTFDFLGIGTLLIPTALAGYAGRDGIFCILAGILFVFFYLKILSFLLADMKESYMDYLWKRCKKGFGLLLLCGYFIYFIMMASYTAYLFSTLVLSDLVKNISFPFVLFLILLLAFYGMNGGMEGRARVYEILFWILTVPLLIMLLAACRQVDVSYWSPVFVWDRRGAVSGSSYVFFCYSVATIVLFLKEYAVCGADGRNAHICKNAWNAVLFSGAVISALYLILLGLFGNDALAHMQFPAVTLMSRVQITGGFLKRTDALMFGIWFFTLYALLGSMIFYAGKISVYVGKKLGFCAEKRKGMPVYFFVIAAVYAAALLIYRNAAFLNMTEQLLWKAAAPFVAVVPACLYFFAEGKKGKKRRRAAGLFFLLACCLFLQGCRVAELEDKEFPLILNIKAEENFERQWLEQEYEGNKVTDYNHLKVVLIEREFLEDEAAVGEMLSMLEKEKELPWNAYVMVTESCDAINETETAPEQPLGNYLEELLENASCVKQDIYPTLGMLYQEKYNRRETVYIPYITIVDEKPAVGAYEVWKRGKAEGLVDTDTALASFFTQNAMREYTLQLSGECFVKITSSSCRLAQETVIGAGGLTEQIVTVHVSGEGVLLSETADLSAPGAKEALNGQTADYLNEIARNGLQRKIDIANSYKKTGQNNRNWYEKYKNKPADYEPDIKIRYAVKINWKNE